MEMQLLTVSENWTEHDVIHKVMVDFRFQPHEVSSVAIFHHTDIIS